MRLKTSRCQEKMRKYFHSPYKGTFSLHCSTPILFNTTFLTLITPSCPPPSPIGVLLLQAPIIVYHSNTILHQCLDADDAESINLQMGSIMIQEGPYAAHVAPAWLVSFLYSDLSLDDCCILTTNACPIDTEENFTKTANAEKTGGGS